MSLQIFAKLIVVAFVVTTMLGVGLHLSLQEIREPFRSTKLTLFAVIGKFLVVPALAFFIARVGGLPRPVATGILVLGTAAGAPILPKLAQFANGNLGFSVGLMFLLMMISILYMPLVLPLLLPAAHVRPWLIAKPLFSVVATPLVIGLLMKFWKESIATCLEPYFRRASTVFLALAILVVFTADYENGGPRISFALIMAGGLLVLFSLGCGFLLGGPSLATRKVLGLGTAQRDLSAALVVAVQNFAEPEVLSVLIAMALLGICLLIPIAIALGRRVAQ